MTVYSHVTMEPEEDRGVPVLRSGPVLRPRVTGKRRIFSPEQKMELARWLDSLESSARRSVFRATKNQWGVHPMVLQRWWREFKSGTPFRPLGRNVSVDPVNFRSVLHSVREAEEKKNVLSRSQVKGLLREEHQRTEDARGDVLHKEMSSSTMRRLIQGVNSHFSVTKKPNKTTEARYRAAASARRAMNFYCRAIASNSLLGYRELLLNVDSTQLQFSEGSSSSEEFFHSAGTKPMQ